MKASVLNRKLHRWGAVLVAVPLLVVIGSGLLLQVKKDFEWIQPEARMGGAGAVGAPSAAFAHVLQAARAVKEAGVQGWDDIDRLDVRPGLGVIKVRCRNRWEIQLDAATCEVLQIGYRRSDLIESLHDGSWFLAGAKRWIFLPAGVILLGLWGTGVYLWLLPHLQRRRRRRA